jgi:hypothetical protein
MSYSPQTVEAVVLAAALMTGGLTLGWEWFAVFRPGSARSRNGIWVTIRMVFMISVLAAWRMEHDGGVKSRQDLDSTRTRLQELTTPRLNPRFTFSSAPFGAKAEDTLVTVYIDISNTGAPSSTDDFRLSATINSTTVEARQWLGKQDQTAGADTLMERLDPREWIPAICNEPIATGGRMSGWEQFLVAGIPVESFRRNGMGAVHLTFYDVNNVLYQVNREIAEQADPPTSRRLLPQAPEAALPLARERHAGTGLRSSASAKGTK